MGFDTIIVGGGPCGVAALLYLTQAGYKCCIIENEMVGGQPTYTTNISNLVGFQGTGEELAGIMQEQVEKTGAEIIYGKVDTIVGTDVYLEGSLDSIKGKAIVIATGARPRTLKELESYKNVHYCSLCDGALYKDKEVVVIGGGNSAFTEGIHLSKICKKVTLMCIQETGFTANNDLMDEFFSKENCEGYLYTKYVYDDTKKEIHIENEDSNEAYTFKIDGIFVSIGRQANSEFIECEKRNGCIVVDKHYRLQNLTGVYAGGDVIDKSIKQISTAIADGVNISQEVIKFIRSK